MSVLETTASLVANGGRVGQDQLSVLKLFVNIEYMAKDKMKEPTRRTLDCIINPQQRNSGLISRFQTLHLAHRRLQHTRSYVISHFTIE